MVPRRVRVVLFFLFLVGVVSIFSSTPSEFKEHVDRHALKYRKWFGEYYWRSDLLPLVDLESTDWLVTDTTLLTSTVAGFNVFDKLYLRSGRFYAVARDPSSFPALESILPLQETQKDETATPSKMHIISPDDANKYLGVRAVVLDGATFIFWDSDPFISHYYRWWGELMLGAMRVYSGLSFVPGIKLPLPEPRRFLLPNVPEHHWRDSAGVNGPILRAGWPSTSIEGRDFWEDLIYLNQTYVFERAMIVSRPAAYTSPLRAQWFKMISTVMGMAVPNAFWAPTQHRVVRNTLGYLPYLNEDGVVASPIASRAPIVTYISRHSGVKKINRESQEGLVKALTELEQEGVCELHVVAMEKTTFSEQLAIIAKTTIMIGIHGTGMTHQLWMPSSPRSTVIEFFHPNAYPNDYELLARNVGHKHYAVWNDTYATHSKIPESGIVEYGTRLSLNKDPIPIHGPTIAEIIRRRLTSKINDLYP
ncbi:hypothetical protein HYPSUDRAFT_1088140 [Hypholoma sublateritium FD-334 SS-4]|uniref:Glycosyltransferase 61 catalytic domain-containing protein n=1 Tax=Hypholoma sublateritium (strain FD-334 SS-4) TaxID=945553 RepID=A0A0D2PNS1_HYPSF|nr:hypothetical protein HYPSUDRAFT_1088140 [Hypholoma sublateritium FD-334 SS-4]